MAGTDVSDDRVWHCAARGSILTGWKASGDARSGQVMRRSGARALHHYILAPSSLRSYPGILLTSCACVELEQCWCAVGIDLKPGPGLREELMTCVCVLAT